MWRIQDLKCRWHSSELKSKQYKAFGSRLWFYKRVLEERLKKAPEIQLLQIRPSEHVAQFIITEHG